MNVTILDLCGFFPVPEDPFESLVMIVSLENSHAMKWLDHALVQCPPVVNHTVAFG